MPLRYEFSLRSKLDAGRAQTNAANRIRLIITIAFDLRLQFGTVLEFRVRCLSFGTYSISFMYRESASSNIHTVGGDLVQFV